MDPRQTGRAALRHHVAERLLVQIIRGELGPGTRLVANALAVQLGVSATPVREALVELEQSGVIELYHHRGASVKAFGHNELSGFYHLRSLVYCDAVRLACGRIGLPQLDGLRNEIQRLHAESDGKGCGLRDVFRIDQRIRRILVDHCPNKWLSTELSRHGSIESALAELVGGCVVSHSDTFQPLVELEDGLRKTDPDTSACAMQRHIHAIAGTVAERIFDSRA